LDFINAIYVAALLFIVTYIYKVPISYYYLLLLHLATVFLTNDFLFPISYMPDQFRYINAASGIRDALDFFNYDLYDRSENVYRSALFFSLFPIPFIKTVFSISIINFFLYALLFVFLYKKKILVGNAIWFYLLYPSLTLYAAIGGRDILIFVIMFLSVYQLYLGRTILSIVISTPLLLIKSQNFIIFIVSIFIYRGIENKNIFSLRTLLVFIFAIAGLAVVSMLYSIEMIDVMRRNMYAEDGGDLQSYIPLMGYFDLLKSSVVGGLYMILKPLPWESGSAMQFLQSFENMFIFYFIYKLIQEQRKIKDKFSLFLYSYLFVAMSIYGIVVFNYGTASRYKFTFIAIFIVFSMSIIYKNRRLKK